MALASIHGDRIRLETEWRERELCKQVPGHRWDSDARTWFVPLSWASCVALRGVFGDGLTIDQDLNAWAAEEIQARVQPCLGLRHAEDATTSIYRGDFLEPLQRSGVQFLTTARQALCADGMGSGKTVEAICAIEEMADLYGEDEVFPCLVVCTNSMVRKWVEEIATWSGRDCIAVKGSAAVRRKLIALDTPYRVINWEGLAGHSRLAGYGSLALTDKDKTPKEFNEIDLKTIVADEAHRGKNPKAKQTRAWWYLSHRATNRLALTGTPVIKSPEDLWSIMHGIAPREWPSKTAFVDRYGLVSWNPWGGMSVVGLRGDTQDELFKFLDPRFIRRPTQAVIKNIAEKLPPQVRRVDLAPKQRKAYKQMRDDMLAEIDGGIAMVTTQLAKMTRLLQLASAYGELDDGANFLMADPSCKVDALVDVVDELDGESLVVFAEHRQLIDLAARRLEKEKVGHVLITGAVSELERSQNVARFQAGEVPVILCTLGAGGEGITLTRARHVVFLQRSWSLAKNMQATDRVWRRGQDRPVQPIWIVAEDTIEERVIALGEDRELTFEEVVRDTETLKRLLT